MYAELMVTGDKVAGYAEGPRNLPDLILDYTNELNRNIEDDRMDDRLVHRVAAVVAWEQLREVFRPIPADLDAVLASLNKAGLSADDLTYLEFRLRILQTVGAGRDRVRFMVDTIAEYFAAMHIVERCADDRKRWSSCLKNLKDSTVNAGSVRGFALALKDWSEAYRQKLGDAFHFVSAALEALLEERNEPVLGEESSATSFPSDN
jgi:hypothetical protein